MQRKMLINALEPEESRIAILEDDVLQELYIQPTATEQYLGNIYKGRITNVERSIQAAFLDIGLPKNAFLHVSEVKPNGADELVPTDGAVATRRKNSPPIQKSLKKGQEIVVQVTKEPIGNKGPSVTTYISLPGRYLVMMPGVVHRGVSRKIQDDPERQRLRKMLQELDLPEKMGFIVRTAGADCRKSDLQRDLRYLKRLWQALEERIRKTKAPSLVYQESDIVIRCLRDVLTPDIQQIVIDTEDACHKAAEFLRMVSPTHCKRVKHYRGATPLFHRYGIEEEIQKTFSNRFPLKSGGSIVIEQAEALVAIDVNSGRYTNEDDIEETAFRTNMEAAKEVARQLRLRDMGGVIVVDFIDMRQDKHRRKVEKTMTAELRRDRARSRVLRMSSFGLMQITRQRVREGTKRALFTSCPTCSGTGLVRSVESMVPHVMRQTRLAVSKKDAERIEVATHPQVAEELANAKRHELDRIERESNRRLRIICRPGLGPGDCEVVCYLKSGKKTTL
ncbi:MAG: ribonuclease E/G [Candidatus Brocadiia bacterium]